MSYNSGGRNTRWDTLGPTTPPGSKEGLISPSATRRGSSRTQGSTQHGGRRQNGRQGSRWRRGTSDAETASQVRGSLLNSGSCLTMLLAQTIGLRFPGSPWHAPLMHFIVSLYTRVLIIQGLLIQVAEISNSGCLPFLC